MSVLPREEDEPLLHYLKRLAALDCPPPTSVAFEFVYFAGGVQKRYRRLVPVPEAIGVLESNQAIPAPFQALVGKAIDVAPYELRIRVVPLQLIHPKRPS